MSHLPMLGMVTMRLDVLGLELIELIDSEIMGESRIWDFRSDLRQKVKFKI